MTCVGTAYVQYSISVPFGHVDRAVHGLEYVGLDEFPLPKYPYAGSIAL